MLPSPRFVALFAFVAIAFITDGRPPGALRLRTEEVEGFITAAGKPAREHRLPFVWIGRV